MAFAVQAETPPLSEDASGALRIGESRVLLELVLRAFQDGATPETIAQRYSTLTLSDVYAVIAYYLRHRVEMDQYLSRRDARADTTARRMDAQNADLSDVRARIQARRHS